MSSKTNGEIIFDYISFHNSKINKQKFESYLNILYDSVNSKCSFSKEVFLFLFPNIPYLIREKFYELLLKRRNGNVKEFTKKIFVDTFLSIMYYSLKNLFKLFIDFFDYTNDQIIYCDDINVLYYHIHHHNGNSDKLIYIKKFIFDIFSYKKFLKKKEFIFKIREKNSNLFYLFIFSLLFSLFKKKDIFDACENLTMDLNIKKSSIILLDHEHIYENFEIIPPTDDLIEYLNQKYNVKLSQEQSIMIIEKDDSLDELNNFEKDVICVKYKFTLNKFISTKFVSSKYKTPIRLNSILRNNSKKKSPMKSITIEEPHIQLSKDIKKTRVKFSFSHSMKDDLLSQLKRRIYFPKKNSISKFNSNKKAIKSQTKELTLSFVKTTTRLKSEGEQKIKIYPKDVFYPVFNSIYYSLNDDKILNEIIIRVFETFLFFEDNFKNYKVIIPISKLFYNLPPDQKEYKNKLLFPLILISQLSYSEQIIYHLYFFSFQNREKFIYQLKCLLGNFNFHRQFIIDKPIIENRYYSIYLGRKNDFSESTIIKIKSSRLEEFDELENSEKFYIKIINKENLKNHMKQLIEEIEISKLLSNITFPNINNIENVFEDHEKIYIIFEQYNGDDISDAINDSIEEKYELIKQLYKGIKSLHNIGIIHSNLIPELIIINDYKQILITNTNEAHLNLLFESNSFIKKKKKNYNFDCPEIINDKKCNYKVDYWNIGIITFYLIYGYYPVNKENYNSFDIEKMIKKIDIEKHKNKKYIINENNYNKEIFNSLNSLIINCVKRNIEERGDEIEDILKIKRTQNKNL